MRRSLALLLAAALVLVGVASPAVAVGTGDVYTTSDSVCDTAHPCRAPIEWRTSVYGPSSGTTIPRRTMFTVFAKAGERIMLGSSSVGWDAADAVVWNPGQITDTMATTLPALVPGTNGFSCAAQRTANPSTTTLGQLRTRAQELAGPQSADGTGNTTGYVPCTYLAPVTGLYRVGFYGTAGGSSNDEAGAALPVVPTNGLFPLFVTPTPTDSTRTSTSVAAWDVTVRPAAADSVADLPGRVFTYAYVAFSGGNPRPVTMQYYLTTLDGFRYRVNTKGFDPNAFVVYGNQVGFLDADGTPLNRNVLAETSGAQTLTTLVGGTQLARPTYPLSFDPLSAETLAALDVPGAPSAPSVSQLRFTGSKSGSTAYLRQGGTFTFTTTGAGTVQVLVSRDGSKDPGLTTNRSLRLVVNAAGTHSIAWDGLDNARAAFPVGVDYQASVELRGGEYHAPMIDVEGSVQGGPSITLENPPSGWCPFTGVTSTGSNCTTAFYDDRGYTTSTNVKVGDPGGALCPSFEGAVPTVRSTGVAGFDSASSQRAFGATTGLNANKLCPASGGTLGDAKGLDLWTYFPSTEATTLVDVAAVPAGPTAANDTGTTATDMPLVVAAPGVLANDHGADLSVTGSTTPAHGTVVTTPGGGYTYTPAPRFSGQDQFGYTVTDSMERSTTATVRITVTPVGQDDTGSTSVGKALVVPAATGVLANDRGASLTATVLGAPKHGSVALAADGGYTYTPAAGYSGTDRFTYQLSDGLSVSLHEVRLTVTPTAADDAGTTPVDTTLVVPAATGVLANDVGTSLTATLVTGPSHGTLTLAPGGAYTYTPDAGFSGLDTFTYSAGDGTSSTVRTVRLTVTPTAVDDSGTTSAGTALTVSVASGVLANDAGALEITAHSDPSHGSIALQADGSYVYTPATGFSGLDSFTYTVGDGTSTLTRTVRITVTPTAADDAGTTPVGTALVVPAATGVLANDVGTSLTARLVTGPSRGSLALGIDGSYTYTPVAGFSGVDQFTYRASDTTSSVVRTVRLTVTPTAADDSATTPVSTTLTVPVASGVRANDAGALTITAHTDPAHGSVALKGDGSYVYAPAACFSGLDSFTYTVSDGTTVLTRTVRITVTPTAADDSGTTAVDTVLTVPVGSGVLANDVGTSLTSVVVTGPSRGAVAMATDGSYTYTPAAGFSGVDQFTYRASDGTTDVVRTVRLTVTPTAVDDSATTSVDTTLTVPVASGVLANDAGELAITAHTDPSHGSVALQADGSYVYAPATGFSGLDSFTYTVTDGTASLTRTVQITVTPAVLDDTSATSVGVALAVPVASGVLANDSGSLTVTASSVPRHGTVVVHPDGSYLYTPEARFSGTDTFTYDASDGTTTLTGTVTVSVTPTAADDTSTTPVGTALVVDAAHGLLANDAGSLTVSASTAPAHGSVVVRPDGSYTYTPAAGFSGADAFTYTVLDGAGHSVTRDVTITVTPTASSDTGAAVAGAPLRVRASAGLLANDGGRLTVVANSAPLHGSVTVHADGSYEYQAPAGFSGVDQFSYTVTDGTSTLVRTVQIDVTAPAPAAVPSPSASPSAGAAGDGAGGSGAASSVAGHRLPVTGADVGRVLLAVLALVGLGAGLLLVTRRRRA